MVFVTFNTASQRPRVIGGISAGCSLVMSWHLQNKVTIENLGMDKNG